ncbi:MAG: hypothetical protein R3C17_19900 [Planctomycetaceae bacterium]
MIFAISAGVLLKYAAVALPDALTAWTSKPPEMCSTSKDFDM